MLLTTINLYLNSIRHCYKFLKFLKATIRYKFLKFLKPYMSTNV